MEWSRGPAAPAAVFQPAMHWGSWCAALHLPYSLSGVGPSCHDQDLGSGIWEVGWKVARCSCCAGCGLWSQQEVSRLMLDQRSQEEPAYKACDHACPDAHSLLGVTVWRQQASRVPGPPYGLLYTIMQAWSGRKRSQSSSLGTSIRMP